MIRRPFDNPPDGSRPASGNGVVIALAVILVICLLVLAFCSGGDPQP